MQWRSLILLVGRCAHATFDRLSAEEKCFDNSCSWHTLFKQLVETTWLLSPASGGKPDPE